MIKCGQVCKYNFKDDGCLKPEWECCPMSNAAHYVTDTNVGNKWISVEESLPEEGEKVLGYSSKNGNYCVGSYSKRWNKWRAAGSPTVTHWMPLPEKPKGDSNA